MKASSGNNWSLQVYNPWPGVMPGTPAENDYVPGFMVDLMVKDLGLAAELARQSEVDAEFGEKARTIYQALQKRGFGGSDFSIVLKSVLSSLD